MKHVATILTLTALLLSLNLLAKNPLDKASALGLVPKPVLVQSVPGHFSLTGQTSIRFETGNAASAEIAAYLQDRLKQQLGLALSISPWDGHTRLRRAVALSLEGTPKSLGLEGYTLQVGSDRVMIRANGAAGLFYGVQTLLQLVPPSARSGGQLKVPEVRIEDWPRFTWRGMHLDVGRHFFPVEFVKKYIDILAAHKMNVFHWHLTEDQGWRIEIKRYPKLTEVGAWRTEDNGQRHGGYYRQDEIRDVVAYAAKRQVTVVPEIEMPGHSLAALAAYPEYSCTGGPFKVPAQWGIFDDVYCPGREETFQFIENILTEVVDLFPGTFMHIGGDECPKARWKACPLCQERIRREGLKDETELQSYFTRRIETFLATKNRRLIGWDEILEGGLPPRATVMSWRGMDGGIFAARSGHDVVMSPTSHCYFDYRQGLEGEPNAIGGYLPLARVYSFEPMPPGLSADEARHILGAQANLWTEYIPESRHAEYMLVPRLCAMAEVTWSSAAGRELADFNRRMSVHYERLSTMGVNFRPPDDFGPGRQNLFLTKKTKVAFQPPMRQGEIRYTLDGTEPDRRAKLYHKPFTIAAATTVRARMFLPDGRSSMSRTMTFTPERLQPAVTVSGLAPGLTVIGYRGEATAEKDLAGRPPIPVGSIDQIRWPKGLPAEPHVLIYTGYITVPTDGIYTLGLEAVAGCELRVGSATWRKTKEDPSREAAWPVALQRGTHPITIIVYGNGENTGLKAFYDGPGVPRQEIPAGAFGHAR